MNFFRSTACRPSISVIVLVCSILVAEFVRADDDASADGDSVDFAESSAVEMESTESSERSEGIGVEGAGLIGGDSNYLFEELDGSGHSENDDYDRYHEEAFVRPGIADRDSSFVPYRAARRLGKGLRAHFESGVGYDSNTLLNDGGHRSPTHPDKGNRGGTVSWFRFGVGYKGGRDASEGRRFIYGFDVGGDLFAYDRGSTEFGRGNAEPYFAPYIGVIGAKTQVRLSTRYDLSEGNYLYSSDARREAPVAESQTWGFNLTVTRTLDRGSLNYALNYRQLDFDADTFLNDQESIINDISYLYGPPSMPKTRLGAGFRWGVYDTTFNPDEQFYEPSLRLNFDPTPKTNLYGRVGYAFREFDTARAIEPGGRSTYALGSRWRATERIRVGLETYRDFSPSIVSAGESFDSDGVKLRLNYASPFWRLHFGAHAAYERADYHSNFAGVRSTREDDFFRFGLKAGRPINLVSWIDTSISLFYDYSQNNSNDREGSFDRHFTGLRFSGSL